ncbi:MAG: enoyl-CoA hydratase [Pseudomonadota bacterium]
MTTTDTDSPLLVERREQIAIVTLNRPAALNALSAALRNALITGFKDLAADSTVQVIILTGAGRAFTVGLDLKELGGERAATVKPLRDNLLEVIAAVPQPIIGAINGYAITGGFELALMCDFLIASPAATFADTHARVGVVPGWGLSQRLPRLIGINRAKELSLTGNFLDAETAERWGLVNRVVAADALLPTCLSLAEDICETDPATRQEMRRIMDEGWSRDLSAGLTLEYAASQAHSRRTRPEAKVAARRSAIAARGRSQSEGEG